MPPAGEPAKWANPITKPKLLVVEGSDDSHFLAALLRHARIEADFEIRDLEGVNNFNRILRALPAVTGFANVVSLGIVRDADQSMQSAFQSVCSALKNANLSVPKHPLSIVGGHPEVSVFIWPDCKSNGTLETLCLDSVDDDPAMPCVAQYLECLDSQKVTRPTAIDKARVHAFLASRKRPGLRIGEAAWPWVHPVFDPIKQFLRAL
jgi:hypothetical protein